MSTEESATPVAANALAGMTFAIGGKYPSPLLALLAFLTRYALKQMPQAPSLSPMLSSSS